MIFFTDNDKPSINASNDSPVEGNDTVILTCHKVTSDADIVKSYEWYKNEIRVDGQANQTYNIGDNRTASANYTCKVVTERTGTSDVSDSKEITFLCKGYSFFF